MKLANLDFATNTQANVLYQLDDGSCENGLGPGNGYEALYLNSFTAKPGGEKIIAISGLSFENPSGHGLGRVVLYNDPDNDGNPINAQLLVEVPFTIESGETGFRVEIPPTNVTGVFFCWNIS